MLAQYQNNKETPQSIAQQLYQTSLECQERCIYFTSKWCAEQLNGMENIQVSPVQKQEKSNTAYLLAHACFQLKEYHKIESILQHSKHPASLFLKYYSKYLLLEKKNEESLLGELFQRQNIPLKEHHDLLKDLENESKHFDGYLLYLNAILLIKVQLSQEAIPYLLQSIQKVPCLWSSWMELFQLISSYEQVLELLPQLPKGFMLDFFLLQVYMEMHPQPQSFFDPLHDQLTQMFPNSLYLFGQKGVSYYHQRQFHAACEIFEELRRRDPMSVEFMDIYSNVLFVLEESAKLSILAQECLQLDAYRPETNLIIGNYYSMKNQHEKAIQAFQQAIRLNRSFVSAWTLMGHEYIELRNTQAALEAYRRAIDVCPHDYRAWYGLGQTYDMLQIHSFAVYYFQKAASLRPFDGRLWMALANVYEQIRDPKQAIAAYKRSLLNKLDPLLEPNRKLKSGLDITLKAQERVALKQIAKLYSELRDNEQAAQWYQIMFDLYQLQKAQSSQLVSDHPMIQEGEEEEEEDVEDEVSLTDIDTKEALRYLIEFYQKKGDSEKTRQLRKALWSIEEEKNMST